jgi:hypothetical protein
VQAVAKLVEDGDYLVVRKRRGLAHRRRKIAGQIGDRMLQPAFRAPAIDRIVHPCAACL